MYVRNWEDFVQLDADGNMVPYVKLAATDSMEAAPLAAQLSEISATATPVPGALDGTEEGDLIAVNLVAGRTYTFDYRGTVGGVVDPFLVLYGTSGAYIAQDDDGGFGRNAMITYTPTQSGTYYLYATSFYTVDGEDPAVDAGGYTINVWSPTADVPGSTNVLNSLGSAQTISVGTNYGNIDFTADNDYFKIDLAAGEVYTFSYAGGVASQSDYNGEPGENVGTITLYNANGAQLGTHVNYESAVTYLATADGPIYVRVQGFNGTGGFTLDVEKVDPSTRDVLESLRWDSAANIDTVDVDGVPTAYVYFGAAGENFGERAPNGTPLVTSGWTAAQQAAVMHALQTQYTPITGIQYLVTTDPAQAEFRMLTVPTATYGARFYPQDPSYGTQEGIGTFNLNSGGFGAYPQSLEQGGFSYAVILHEFGHAHGIAHPHDNGGGSEILLGVNGATGSLGLYNLNQGVYTVMSYNDAWQLHPNGPSAFTVAGIDNGWSGTLSAFDIAVLQERYGRHAHNTGDNVYALTDVADDAFYQTIWDSSGVDTIAYGGALDAHIDLTAATLDYTPTGGGVLSFLYNDPDAMPTTSFRVRGGYTIANGVVIENATGGSGDDVLLGNAAANTLTGNAGDDALEGRDGNDTLNGGIGADLMRGGVGNDLYFVDGAGDSVIELAGEGTDTVSSSISYTLGDNVENLILTGTASSGTGNGLDNTLTGNGLSNQLNGGAGNDRLIGGDGVDFLFGGAGNDVFVAEINATKVPSKTGPISLDVILDFAAGDKIDLSGIDANSAQAGHQAFTFVGNAAGKGAGELSMQRFGNMNAAERALGMELDGIDGKSTFEGPVTVLLGNVDGGDYDFAMAIVNTPTISTTDLIFV
jgi:serralysin